MYNKISILVKKWTCVFQIQTHISKGEWRKGFYVLLNKESR